MNDLMKIRHELDLSAELIIELMYQRMQISSCVDSFFLKEIEIKFDDELSQNIYEQLKSELCQTYESFFSNINKKVGTLCTSEDFQLYQAIVQRIMLGVIVARIKYTTEQQTYQQLFSKKDYNGIENKLSDIQRENLVLENIRCKASRFSDEKFTEKAFEFFKEYIIPLTKKIELIWIVNTIEIENK